VRRLVSDLGLQEKKDVFFLGFVSDAELLDLYQRCAVVINASLYDNGSFNLAEAAYFGRPAVSSDYPAARFLCERFGVRAHFFPSGDASGLAKAIQEALGEGPQEKCVIEQARKHFEDPEYTSLRFAERVCALLSEIAVHSPWRPAA
jgi:glycosyltransferase involved in cell wall biosynthesis